MTIKKMLNDVGGNASLAPLTDEQMAQIKKILLETCTDILNFCRENGMTCALGGGSALGAVRHKGFIPWDDDIDLNMPRSDYNRFLRLFEEKYQGKYQLFAPDGTHQAAALSAKVSRVGTVLEDLFSAGSAFELGVSVDIFSIENVPANALTRRIKGILCGLLQGLAVSVYYAQNKTREAEMIFSKSWKTKWIYRVRLVLGRLLSFRPYGWWFHKYDRFIQHGKETGLVTVPTGRRHYFGEILSREDVFPLREAPFEDKNFFVYNHVEKYLEALYGDYMTIPPVEQQEKHLYVKVSL